MKDSTERLYDMADERLAKELGEGRWTTDHVGDQKYTEEAQDKFLDLKSDIDDLTHCCYWDIYTKNVISSEEELSSTYWLSPLQSTVMWVLQGRHEGDEDDVYLFTSKELAEEGLKLLFCDEYGVYENLEPAMSFKDFLEEFCQ